MTRRFALTAWLFLGLGLLLGSRWSYEELGWGGYWGWDPVENAALMPFLVTTAFIHSIMVQERRGMLEMEREPDLRRLRAGAARHLPGSLGHPAVDPRVQGLDGRGPLLVPSGIVAIGATALIISRLPDLRPERRIQLGALARPIFLVNNLLLVGLAAIVFWGTFFPLIAEFFTGTRSSLGSPWFDRYVTPIGVLLVLFTGIGPLLAWGRLPAPRPWAGALVACGRGGRGRGRAGPVQRRHRQPLGADPVRLRGLLLLVALSQEFWRAGSARRALTGERYPAALLGAIGRNRRRYGGYGPRRHRVPPGRDCRLLELPDQPRPPPGGGGVGHSEDYEVTYKGLDADPENERIAFRVPWTCAGTASSSRCWPRRATSCPTQDPMAGPIGRFFDSEATSEIGLPLGQVRISGPPSSPTSRRSTMRSLAATPARRHLPADAQGIAILALAEEYAANPPPPPSA